MRLPPATQNLALAMRECNDPSERDAMHGCQMFYHRQFIAAKHTLTEPESIAAGMHDAIDRSMQRLCKQKPKQARRVACRKGCAHCCYVHVDITQPEARLLIDAAAAINHTIDTDRLRKQRDAPVFEALSLDERRCVFLGSDNTCAVYEHRPIACRKYLVLDTAKLCDTVKHPRASVCNFVSIDAECQQSAAFHAFENGLMATQLLEWL